MMKAMTFREVLSLQDITVIIKSSEEFATRTQDIDVSNDNSIIRLIFIF
jgi:hypothetical protein